MKNTTMKNLVLKGHKCFVDLLKPTVNIINDILYDCAWIITAFLRF